MADSQIIMRNFKFTVTIDGGGFSGDASFNEVSGFDATYDVAEYRAGNDPYLTPRKFPGLVKYGNITMKRGLVGENNNFMTWIQENINGNISKTMLHIALTDPASGQTVTWNVRNAWPVKYTGPDLNGNASEVAIETIEIAHEGIDRDGIGGPGGLQ